MNILVYIDRGYIVLLVNFIIADNKFNRYRIYNIQYFIEIIIQIITKS